MEKFKIVNEDDYAEFEDWVSQELMDLSSYELSEAVAVVLFNLSGSSSDILRLSNWISQYEYATEKDSGIKIL